MPTATPSLPPLSPRIANPPVMALDDVKLQFVTDEVRKRFSTISLPEMLQVLNLLLTDQRILECEVESSLARADGKTPKDGQLDHGTLAEQLRKNSGSLLQQMPSGNSSVTASDLSPRDWGSLVFENNDAATPGSPATARLNREWKSTITFILDNARQYRQSDNESNSIKQLVQASITEWFNRSGAADAHPERTLTDSSAHHPDQAAWLSIMAKVCRLSEDACYQKYEMQYSQLHTEAENENDDGAAAGGAAGIGDDDSVMAPPSALARRSVHRSTTGSGSVGGIPPFSLVIQCTGPSRRSPSATTSQDPDADDDTATCLVVGCEWFQWVFLVQCPVACACQPYPTLADGCSETEAAAVRAARRKWRQRHCTVQLLYPSEAGFSASPDSGSDLRSADAEYELSEPQVVLSSLLGVAMRVWCQSHPHLVAEVFQLEEDTYPQHLYDGTSFWSMWPIRDANTWQQCESTGSSESMPIPSMPIPLLPGECFAQDSDLEEDEKEDSENDDE